MMTSLFSAESGLTNHQIRMDVIGNNVANVNTPGFKSGRVSFEDTLQQSLQPAREAVGGFGGQNPREIGLGMTVSAIDVLQTQGLLQTTGKTTDLAIQGDGYFVMTNGTTSFYSRDGSLNLDASGNLVNAGGYKVMGWKSDVTGTLDPTQPITTVNLPMGQQVPASATSSIAYQGNLDASTVAYTAGPPATGGKAVVTSRIYDSLGTSHDLYITFTNANTAGNVAWNWAAALSDGTAVGNGAITFDNKGNYVSSAGATAGSSPTINVTTAQLGNNAAALTSILDFKQMTQTTGTMSAATQSQNGFAAGSLQSISVGQSGVITGVYSNGKIQSVGQVATATFSNPSGLTNVGGDLWQASLNSGLPQVGVPGSANRGMIVAGALEMSNVDLAKEFTDLIVTQRGFQANSRVITTTDEMLQELLTLKR